MHLLTYKKHTTVLCWLRLHVSMLRRRP